ncbi:MAG: L,D-transpeptidase [Bdellovibrionales bacterium]|nr:L,D-transpeptidase [Bdellovibrionales bacterium]
MKSISAIAIFLLALTVAPLSAQAACKGKQCPLFVHVSIPEQLMYVYQNGEPVVAYQVSTGLDGYDTASYSGHPVAGRIYERYSSKKFPGGNYIDENGRGLGNMPYAMFFYGGYAIHGTPTSNWAHIGREASHGCVRMYPHQAKELNRMVRQLGVENVWFFIDRKPVGKR